MAGMKIEGRSRLSKMFVSGSKTEYDTKKMVRAELYCWVVRPSDSFIPAILALPMLVLSRKARRYRIQS